MTACDAHIVLITAKPLKYLFPHFDDDESYYYIYSLSISKFRLRKMERNTVFVARKRHYDAATAGSRIHASVYCVRWSVDAYKNTR